MIVTLPRNACHWVEVLEAAGRTRGTQTDINIVTTMSTNCYCCFPDPIQVVAHNRFCAHRGSQIVVVCEQSRSARLGVTYLLEDLTNTDDRSSEARRRARGV